MTAKPAKVRDYEQSDSSRSKTAQSSDSSKTSKGGGDTPSTAPAPARKKKKKKAQENENASNSTSKGGETKTSKKRKSPTKSDVEAQSTVQSKVSQRKVQPKHKNFSNLLDSKSSTIAVGNTPEAATPEVDEPGGLAGGNFGLLLETKQAEKLCLSLGLQKRNVEAMRRFFDHEEELGTGDITIDEFFSMLHEQPRQLTKGLFEAVGLVRNLRRIRFDEFVICIATVATWSKSELLHYAFKQFDIDESGVMDGRELRAFCEGLKNDSSFYFANNVNKAREKLVIRDRNNRYQYFKEKQSLTDEDIEANTVVDLEDLAKGSTEFQVAFYPLLQLQQSVRSCAPGERFWAKVAQRRQEVEVIVHYMRMHKGELPSFSIVKRIIAYLLPSSQANAQLAVHKLAILKYAEEERIWQEQAHARAEADKLAQTGSQE